MPKREISTDAVRKPMGIFSQATVVEAKGRLVFISGMTARRPDGSIAGIGDITEQTRQVCENIQAAVQAAGGTLDHVCRVDVYVRNMEPLRRSTPSADNILNRRFRPQRWSKSRRWSRPSISSRSMQSPSFPTKGQYRSIAPAAVFIGADPFSGALTQARKVKQQSSNNEDSMIPKGAPGLDEILIQSEMVPWRAKSLKGIHEKMLWRSDESGASIALIRFDKGSGIPEPHLHSSNQFMFCLKGRYEYTATGVVLTPGCFYCNPKGNVHGPAIAHEDTVVIEIYDGPHYPQKPSWYADEEDAR